MAARKLWCWRICSITCSVPLIRTVKLGLFGLWFWFLLVGSGAHASGSQRIFNLLLPFYRNNQIFIEALPPMAFFLASQNIISLPLNALHSSEFLGESLTAYGSYLSIRRFTESHSNSPLPEILVGIAVLFSTAYTSMVYATAFAYITRVVSLFRGLCDRRITIRKALIRHLMATTLALSCQTTLVLAGFGIIYSFSELSYGGNYNLHYLSPASRRAMRPSISNLSMTAHSFYVPSAGFLWSDGLHWNELSNTWTTQQNILEELLSKVTPGSGKETAYIRNFVQEMESRVIMADRTNKLSPWAIRKIVGETKDSGAIFSDGITSFQSQLKNGDSIILQDLQSQGYLSVQPDKRSIVDQLFYITEEHGEIERARVSVTTYPSSDSVFEYHIHPSGGFRLFQSDYGCFIATSFRSVPDLHRFYGHNNDTLGQALNQEIEVICRAHANEPSSVLYVIEGSIQSGTLIGTCPGSRLLLRIYQICQRGLEYLTAVRKAYSFRRLYASLQDKIDVVEYQNTEGPTDWCAALSRKLECIFIILVLLKAAFAQRYRSIRSCKDTVNQLQITTCFVVLIIHRSGAACVGGPDNINPCPICAMHAMLGLSALAEIKCTQALARRVADVWNFYLGRE